MKKNIKTDDFSNLFLSDYKKKEITINSINYSMASFISNRDSDKFIFLVNHIDLHKCIKGLIE